MNPSERFAAFNQIFQSCSPFYRDTTLSAEIMARYKPGLFLREPTFCDASHKAGGLVAPHRYLIISAHARDLGELSQTPEWGICLWMAPVFFKVLDQVERDSRVQTTLLEIPIEFLDIFCNQLLVEDVESFFVSQARSSFERCLTLQPLPELNTDDWRARLEFPLGIADDGGYFPLFPNELLNPDTTSTARTVLRHQAEMHLAMGNNEEAKHLLGQADAICTPSQRPAP